MHRGTRGLVLCLLIAAAVTAQERTSLITGVVTDPSGAAVAGATVTARNVATAISRSVTTGREGYYQIPHLEVGVYEVTAGMAGFMVSAHEGVILEVGRATDVDHRLQLGALSETIVVTGEARIVEAAPSALTSVVNSVTIEELPLNGRDYVQLAMLQAGAPMARAQTRNENNGWGVQISIAGSRPIQNGFQLDGVSLNSYNGSTPGSVFGVNLGVDAIQEFSVQSSTYSAQYGRAAGGIVSAVTRAGTNDFHGSAFWFHRNDNLDARNFFDVGEPPEFRRHQFGGSLGGPIVSNRTFFFVNYESLRELRGNTTIDTTLGASARQGNLVGGSVTVDPVMAKVADLFPLPNGEVLGDTGLYIFANDTEGVEQFVTTRIDQQLRDSDSLFFRYNFDDGDRVDETSFGLLTNSDSTRNQSAVLEETHIFSPTMLNTARFGFLRTNTNAGYTTTQNAATDDPDLAFVPSAGVIGLMVIGGLTEFPGGTGALDPRIYVFNSYQLSDDFSWFQGRHSVKLGGRFERTQFNSDSRRLGAGEFRFASIEDFLTNKPERFRGQLPGSDTIRGHRQWIGALYFQDTMHLTRRLTLDLGVRWEWATVPNEVNGKIANLDTIYDTEMRVGGPLFRNPSWKNIVPRAGVAFDLFGNGSTMIRAGYGVFPDLVLSQFIVMATSRNTPFYQLATTRDVSVGEFPNGVYPKLLDAGEYELRAERIDPNLNQPYVQQWNLNVEQILGANTTFRIGYAGSHGLNLSSVMNDANIVEPITLPDGRLFYPEDGERLNSVWGRLRNRSFDAHSFYNGLIAQLQRRLSDGLRAQFSYSFSKSIDDSSNYYATSESANFVPVPINGPASFNRGRSSHDVRHYVVANATWDLPLGEGRGGWRRLLGGWQASTIVTYASGLPITPRLGYDAARTQTGDDAFDTGQRPDVVLGAARLSTGDHEGWINVSAFRRPEPGFQGNAGRNIITGPDLTNVDFSLHKDVRLAQLGEGATLEFRAEFFNLFNHTNFDLPELERTEVFTEDSAREDAGRITSAGKSREIQFGLKLRF